MGAGGGGALSNSHGILVTLKLMSADAGAFSTVAGN